MLVVTFYFSPSGCIAFRHGLSDWPVRLICKTREERKRENILLNELILQKSNTNERPRTAENDKSDEDANATGDIQVIKSTLVYQLVAGSDARRGDAVRTIDSDVLQAATIQF